MPAVRAVNQGHSIGGGVDYRGIPVLSATLPIPGTGWFLVAKVDRAEALSNLRWLWIVTFLLVILLMVIVGIILVLRYRKEQFERSIALATQEKLFHEVLDHATDAIVIATPGLQSLQRIDRADCLRELTGNGTARLGPARASGQELAGS